MESSDLLCDSNCVGTRIFEGAHTRQKMKTEVSQEVNAKIILGTIIEKTDYGVQRDIGCYVVKEREKMERQVIVKISI